MLVTSLGDIIVAIDGKNMDVTWREMGADEKLCPDIYGRYCLEVFFEPDGKRHTISCRIKDHVPSENDGIESGERLELKSFYKGKAKLSIGMEGETGYYPDGTRAFDTYDYDNEYLADGVQYVILPETKTRRYCFLIAWIEKVTDENDIQTWFAADPTYI